MPLAKRPVALRRPRRCVVGAAGDARTTQRAARALAESLDRLGVVTIFLGNEENPDRIAAVAAEEQADSVELCFAGGGGGVLLLRALLRELTAIGRRDVSIVVHRVR